MDYVGVRKENRVRIDGYFSSTENDFMDQFLDRLDHFLKENNVYFIGKLKTEGTLTIAESDKPDNELDLLWEDATKLMQIELVEITYKTWIKPIIPYDIIDSDIILVTDSEFTKDLLNKKYRNFIRYKINEVAVSEFDVVIITKEEAQSKYNVLHEWSEE